MNYNEIIKMIVLKFNENFHTNLMFSLQSIHPHTGAAIGVSGCTTAFLEMPLTITPFRGMIQVI